MAQTAGQGWAQAIRARLDAEAKAARIERKAKAKTAKKEPRLCGCGCGQTTKGGWFMPGHDGALVGAFKAVERGNASLDGAPRAIAVLFSRWTDGHGHLTSLLEHGISPKAVKAAAAQG